MTQDEIANMLHCDEEMVARRWADMTPEQRSQESAAIDAALFREDERMAAEREGLAPPPPLPLWPFGGVAQ